ncbi:MAG: DUF11 domain-containing protein [Deltaproteobacteria bacterium]|nr:DUF11 domain-containing protein [Deltaproteobacteria bacterium]
MKRLFSSITFIIGLLFPVFLCCQAFAVDLQISQLVDNPDPGIRGGQITYSITVENNANDTATGVQLSVPLPADTSFVSVSGHPSCSHDGGTPGTVTCNLGDLVGTLVPPPTGPGPIITIDVVIQTTATTPSTINIGPPTGPATITSDPIPPDTNPANNSLTQNTTIDDGADLIVAKSDTPDPVIAGGNVTYTIDVTNNGPNDAYTITVEDTLSPNMTYVSAGGTGWSSCSHNGVNPGGVVTCQRTTIANGVTAPVISLVVQETGAFTGTITNTVNVSAATGDPDINNNTITEDTIVNEGADLAITKQAVGFVIGGDTATFRLRPRNNGPFDAQTVEVADIIPAGFTGISASGPGWTCNVVGQDVSCTRATYAVGATDDILVQATAPVSGAGITNTGVITSTTPDPNLSNNSDSITFDIVPDGADLSVNKTKSPDPVAQGSDITSTFVMTNNGPRATSGTLTLVETLPAGETYQSYSGTDWSCSYAAGPPETLTCTYSATPLAVGASTSTLTIITTATGTGPLTNIGTVSDVGGQPDGVPGNNDDSETVVSTAEKADLTIAKSADAGGDTTLTVGETTITYTLAVTNTGPDASTGVVVTDTVAGYFSSSTGVPVTTGVAFPVATPPTHGFTCNHTNGTVTCTGGNIPDGETATITIDVTRPLFDGSQTNTATVNSTDVGDPDHTNNSDTATVTIDPICDVQMQGKTVSPNPVTAGTEATYVMTFGNNGPSSAGGFVAGDDVVVTDTITVPASVPPDSGFTLVSVDSTQGTCAGLIPGNSYGEGAYTLTCTIGTLTNGQSETLTVVIRPNWQSGDPDRTFSNIATIGTGTTESNAGNNSRTATLNVETSDLDLLVNKTDLVDPIGYDPGVPANNIITYEVVINNRGPSLATTVVLADAMTPKNGKTLTFRGDWDNPNGSGVPSCLCDNVGNSVTGPVTQNITCNFPNLAPNSTYTRYLLFEVITAPDATGDTHYNIATVSSNEIERNVNNNAEEENTSVRQRVDLVAAKVPSSPIVQLREPFNWIITVTNNGPGQSIYTNVTDTLPAGMEFYGPAPPSWDKSGTAPLTGTCSPVGQDLTCDLGWFEPGEVATITVPVRVTAYPGGGTTTNCATATTSEYDPNPGNNTGCGTVTVQRSSIEGYVYRDLNDNGAMEGGETGINGVTLTLAGIDDYGNTVDRTTTTNAGGFYRFNNLSPSDASGYTITETQPPLSYFDGLDSRDNGASAIPGSRTTDVISSIIVPANTALAGYLFGEIPAASISGYVWSDEDNDGVRDAGETTGIPNVQITLTGTDYLGNPVTVSTTTNASGAYGFGPLRAGTYTVTETQPLAWADGLDSVGSAGGTLGNDIISNIDLSTTTIATDYNFGEIGGSLAGTVYNDINNNGIDEPAEPGIPNVTVTLTGTDINGNAVNLVTTTASDGSYSFDNLPMPNAAGYTITETPPAGWIDGQDTVGTLGGSTAVNDVFSAIVFPTPGALGTGYNFGERQGAAGVAQVSGTVWLDLDHQRDLDAGEPLMANWTVELIQRANPTDTTYTLIATTTTNAAGAYAITGLSPGTYEIRFRHPSGGYIYGHPISVWPGVDLDYGTIRDLTLAGGDDAINQNLPLDPSGVIYDAVTRVRVAGATITISGPPGFDPAVHLVGGAANATQTTGPMGDYQFLLLNTAPTGTYTLTTTSPPGYVPGISTLIPPCSNTLTVLAAPAPAVVQNNDGPPSTDLPGVCPADSGGLAAGADTTQYFLSFSFTPLVSANVVNNHIPLDPAGEAFFITKSVNKKTVSIGDLILYTLRIQNTTGAPFVGTITIRDNIPAGFKYVDGSARIDGQSINPVGTRPLEFQNLTFAVGQTRTITYILVVGSGVQEGEYKNTAFAMRGGNRISNIASASVCVIKDPIFELTTIIGKVFHDKNGNGIQDEGEEGIAMAKVISVRGEIVTTDKFGRYHIAGVDPGRWDRGRNFILKVDPKSLPAGTRFTTENPRVVRITSALMKKINFGVQLPAAVPSSQEGVEPVQDTHDGKTPIITVSQDRFITDPRLNVSLMNDAILRTDAGLKEDIAFYIYTNYPDFIQEYKISIYDKKDVECIYPLKTIELQQASNYEPVYWNGILDNGELIDINKEYKYILEVYNEEGRRDETIPKFFTVSSGALFEEGEHDSVKALTEGKFPGFGIDNTAQRSIIPKGEKVVFYGKNLAPTDHVYIDEEYVPVDEEGGFIAESIKPPGEHHATIIVKDNEGGVKASQTEKVDVDINNKEGGGVKAFFKDFFTEFFIVGIVDVNLGQYSFSGHVEPVAQDDHYDEEIYVDGRAAFYLKGKIKGKYLLTAYLDTEDGEIQDIYKRFDDKDPKRIFRNLDPDKYYPVYGDDSTLISDVETQGRFYVRLEWDKSEVLWGNYNTQITGTELARYNRSLYGAKVYYESLAETQFGDSKGMFTGFVSQCQTLQDHNEFLSTGGSLYYLRNQRVVEGSEKVAIEIRDKDSGRVISIATLLAGADYEIDYYQGRILLSSPLPILANSQTIISSALINGDSVFLVVDYEYNTDCFGCTEGVENLTAGARGFWWIFDQFGLGSTFVRETRDNQDYNLYGVDAKIKLFKGTYTNFEFASSQQTQIPGLFSVDGGLSFAPIESSATTDRGNAFKAGQVIDFKEITDGAFPLGLEAYYVFREEGFSSLGKETEHDTTEFGVNARYDITKNHFVSVKHSTFDEADDFYESISTAQLESHWTDRFRSIFEVRHKKLDEDENNIQPEHPEADTILGTEEDVIAGIKLSYDFNNGTELYAAQQVTLYNNDNTPENNKTTIGINSQITEWLRAGLEGFGGNLGYGGRVGLMSSMNDKVNTYTSYMFSTDRTEGRTHTVTFGSTAKVNERTDVYSENQFKESRLENAFSDIIGIRYLPNDRWNIDVKYESAHVTKDTADSYVEHNIIKRDTASFGVTYDHEPFKASSRFEMRFDRGDVDENQYITTTSLKYTVNKEWSFLANCNFSLTHNQTMNMDDAHFFEISTGFAYRPIKVDKLNMLFKYTFLEDLPPLSQVGSTEVDERSHVVSLEGIYDLSRYFSVGGKAAYKSAQMRMGRTSGEWFSSDTVLFAGRLDYHVIKNWDASLEYRFLKVFQAEDYKHGPLVCLYRHFGDHIKVGVGYNFTDFNDDLTNLSYDAGGWFVNFVAKW